jgi:hypothetical protein
VVIRFPAFLGLGTDRFATLTIDSVLALDSTGASRQVIGPWSFQVLVPFGSDARAAAALEAFAPASARAGVDSLIIEGFRTETATVLRYRVPPAVVENGAPSLKTGGTTVLQSLRSQQTGREREVWFAATPAGSPITAVFNRLLVSDASGTDATIELEITGSGPQISGGPGSDSESRALTWEQTDASGIRIASIVRYRDLRGVTMRVVVDGLWNPELAGKPLVIADGHELFVRGLGNYPAIATGPQTDISVDVPDGVIPKQLTVRLMGKPSVVLSALEVPLTP